MTTQPQESDARFVGYRGLLEVNYEAFCFSSNAPGMRASVDVIVQYDCSKIVYLQILLAIR